MINHKITSGFTLVELVMVLILTAILAAVAGPRFFNESDFDERGFYDQVTAAARFAQKYAVTSGVPVTFAVVANTSFALTQSGGGVLNPGTLAAFTGNLPAGVTPFSMAPAASITFDAFGTVPAMSTGSATITVGSRPITIWGATGFVDAP